MLNEALVLAIAAFAAVLLTGSGPTVYAGDWNGPDRCDRLVLGIIISGAMPVSCDGRPFDPFTGRFR